MSDSMPDALDLARLRHRALSRWDNEGGATPGGPQVGLRFGADQCEVPRLTNSELVQLRVRLIALENLVISLLSQSPDRLLDFVRDMAAYICPRPGFTPHHFTIGAAAEMIHLVAPLAIGHPSWSDKTLPISITREQVKNSPDIDTDKPVSRQHEIKYFGYYGYPYYWGGTGLWGEASYPGTLLTGVGYDGFDGEYKNLRANATSDDGGHQPTDQHLRSCNVVSKYRVHASDGDLGHVQGLLVDERTWSIRYMIVDTSNWWVGHSVLISPEWIDNVSWINEKVSIDLTRQAIKDAPSYDSTVQLNREHELGIYQHYGRTGYWTEDAKHRVAL